MLKMIKVCIGVASYNRMVLYISVGPYNHLVLYWHRFKTVWSCIGVVSYDRGVGSCTLTQVLITAWTCIGVDSFNCMVLYWCRFL